MTMTCGRIVFKFYKKQTKSKNHEIYHDITHEDCGKKKLRFRTSCDVRRLKNEASPKKNHRVEKDSLRFGVKLMVEF